MGEYTPEEFDRLVAALRGKVAPKSAHRRKEQCTPAEWAAQKDYGLKWRSENADKAREYWQKYRSANGEKTRERQRKYRESNPERRRESVRQWQAKNPEKRRAASRKRHAANPEKNNEQCRKWRASNQEKRRDGFRRWHRKAIKTDEGYRMACNLRRRLCVAIKDGAKSGSAVRDLGCTIAELWLHLESKFQPGMTSDNMGTAWHLDHIYPLAKANLQDRAQFLAVNNWRNLQPMTPDANIAKSNTVTPEAQALFDQLCAEFA